MAKGETIVRYFLTNSVEEEFPVLANITYNSTENYPVIIPQLHCRLLPIDIISEKIVEDDLYDYYIIDSIDYALSRDFNSLIDIMVTGYDEEKNEQ